MLTKSMVNGKQFAHRKCIQKWCNKKGDITCEICNQVGCHILFYVLDFCLKDCKLLYKSMNYVVHLLQVFTPNYLPPPKPASDVLAVDIR